MEIQTQFLAESGVDATPDYYYYYYLKIILRGKKNSNLMLHKIKYTL